MNTPEYTESEKRIQKLEQELARLQEVEKNLELSRRAFWELTSLLTEGVFECDNELSITFANQAALKMFGKESLISCESLYCLDFIAPADRDRANRDIRLIRSGRSCTPKEYKALRADGSAFPALFHSVPVYADDHVIGIRGIIVDLTEQRLMEEQLLQRQKLDSLGLLAGGVAHDFNNLLSGIMGYLNVLSLNNDNMTEKQKMYITKILDSVKRGGSIISQFQNISIDKTACPEHLDIYPVAKDVFSILERTTNRIIQKHLDIEPDTFFIRGRADELHQVLMNLAANAVHAIEEKGASGHDYIRLSASSYPGTVEADSNGNHNGTILLAFEDTGKGMTEEVKKQAFNPLFTTKSNNPGASGSGLGLAMVHKIVTEKFDASIRVSSSPGRGTTFKILFPKSLKSREKADPALLYSFGGNETILLVDDDDLVLESAATGLQDYGYNVITAADGREGLEVFRSEQSRIDIVLLDLNMPEISGCDLFERMLEIDPDIRVIITSGYRESYNDREVLLKAVKYLQKPYELHELERAVREAADAGKRH
ncbi:MAG: response regulator [Thermodesulfobacteriota bacterium]